MKPNKNAWSGRCLEQSRDGATCPIDRPLPAEAPADRSSDMDADQRDLKDDEAKGEKELLHKGEMNHYKQDLQDIIGLGDDPVREVKGGEAIMAPGISGVPLLGDPPGIYITPASQYRQWNTGYNVDYYRMDLL
ncbi:hypothetical protein HNY73_009750 [Argiope bruennichi]|uniref:Uncharacterized protein n=1 Tax=Argiope bruennichi TaxID=94029 RepID=A0A8T0FFK3_ARGBR|nr:hypothetical protein HNY73_009750 [Argiope bruennichi]